MDNIFFHLAFVTAILFLLLATVITIVSLIRDKDRDLLWIGVIGIYLILLFGVITSYNVFLNR
jgi:hypothetical protein